MKNFFRKAKRVLIAFLVFVFSVTLLAPASPASAAAIGMQVGTGIGVGQNLYYGNAKNSVAGYLLLLQKDAGINSFQVDTSGNVSALGNICDGGGRCLNTGSMPSAGAAGSTLYSDGIAWKTSQNIYNNNGNVGIGKIGPDYKLEVNGPAFMIPANVKFIGGTNYNENIRMYPGSNDYSSLVMGAVVGDSGTGVGQWGLVRYPALSNYLFGIRYNATDYFNITNGGNVGIGTTNPGARLEVNGQVKITGGLPGANKVLTTVDGSGLATWETPSGGGGIGGSGTANYVSKFTAGAAIGNSIIFDNGTNVGIGSATPGYKFDVNGDVRASIYRFNANATPYITAGATQLRLYYDAYLYNTMTFTDSSWNPQGSISGAGNIVTVNSNTGAGYVNLQTNGGRVGIGTTAPTARLDVSGNLAMSGGSSEIEFKDASGNIRQYVWYTGSGLGIGPGSTNNSIIIDSTGNVGIGTASPGTRLEVAGQIKITGGSPGANKVLTSDNSGLATWQALSASGVGGSGTVNYLPKFTAGAILGDSNILDNGTYMRLTSSQIDIGGLGTGSVYPVNLVGAPYVQNNLKAVAGITNTSDSYDVTPVAGLAFRTFGSPFFGVMTTGGISFGKENATSGNTDSFFDVYTNSNSYGLNSALHINSAGNVAMGKSSSGGTGPVLTLNSLFKVSNSSAALVLNGQLLNPATPITMYFKDNGAGNGNFFLTRNGNDAQGISMDSTGNIGIGGLTPGTYRFYVFGAGYATANWVSSDIRWKKDVTPLKDSLSKVLKLQGVNYQWNIKDYPDRGFTAGKQTGLIAQDTEKVIPELVNTDKDGYKAVSYEKLTAVLVEAMKEQQKQIEELKAEIKTLKK